MSTDKAPDFAGVAERMADKAHPVWKYRDMDKYNAAARKVYASCMEARLRSDWETIRLLKKVKHAEGCHPQKWWEDAGGNSPGWNQDPCTCGLSAHLSKLLEPFTP